MTLPTVLLVDEDPSSANRRAGALRSASFDVFCASCQEEAKEALHLRLFDAVLVAPATKASSPSMAESIRPATRRSTPPVLLVGFADSSCYMPSAPWDALIPSETPDGSLATEILQALRRATTDAMDESLQLAGFDFAAFREQMGEDRDLMSEIVGLFFEESGAQLRNLRDSLTANEFDAVSRVAHSLKGSLGSIHAGRARHWAAALETSAVAKDHQRSERCLSSLEKAVAALTPELQPLLL